jgi:hypothetical protein
MKRTNFFPEIIWKKNVGSEDLNQGDQTQFVIVYSTQIVENYRSSPHCYATFSAVKVMR